MATITRHTTVAVPAAVKQKFLSSVIPTSRFLLPSNKGHNHQIYQQRGSCCRQTTVSILSHTNVMVPAAVKQRSPSSDIPTAWFLLPSNNGLHPQSFKRRGSCCHPTTVTITRHNINVVPAAVKQGSPSSVIPKSWFLLPSNNGLHHQSYNVVDPAAIKQRSPSSVIPKLCFLLLSNNGLHSHSYKCCGSCCRQTTVSILSHTNVEVPAALKQRSPSYVIPTSRFQLPSNNGLHPQSYQRRGSCCCQTTVSI